MQRLFSIFILTLLLASSLVYAQEDATPRTQYESFDLSTPEAAVTTFVDLFQNRDYAGLFVVLAPEAQSDWYAAINRFRYEFIIEASASEGLIDAMGEVIGFDHTETEQHPNNIPYLFDSVMLYAEEQDAFPIDLRGEVEILRTEESIVPAPSSAEDSDDDETPLPAIDVIVSTEDQGELRFRMVQVPSGRWRVYQVIVPGGDEQRLPWAIKASDSE
jgi:hypothetical protein